MDSRTRTGCTPFPTRTTTHTGKKTTVYPKTARRKSRLKDEGRLMKKEQAHSISQLPDGRYTCSVCLWIWKKSPTSPCPSVAHYQYGAWPEHLYTFTQLREKKLKPVGEPEGCYFIRKVPYVRYLYSIHTAVQRRVPTERQREAIAKMRDGLVKRYTCRHCGYYDSAHGKGKYGKRVYQRSGLCVDCERLKARREKQAHICEWAHRYLQGSDFVVLDSETTGLNERGTDEIIELAIVSSSGTVLFSSLIQPQDLRRQDLATHIHGITQEQIQDAPRFPDVWPTIKVILRHYRSILVYNAAFDCDLLATTAKRYGYEVPGARWTCLMEAYAVYHGAWHSYYRSYTWQKLIVACDVLGVERQGEDHRATPDALNTLGVLKALAARHGTIELLPPPVEPISEQHEDDLSSHPF
jgi:DNA polymerase III epsilon subunit-like protein